MKKMKAAAAVGGGETVFGADLEIAFAVLVAVAGRAELVGLPGFETAEQKVFAEDSAARIMSAPLVSPTGFH